MTRFPNHHGLRRRGQRPATAAFTKIELMVALFIVSILALLSIQGFAKYRQHAAKATCISKMRVVHAGLGGYFADVGHWPQPQIDFETVTEEDYFGWWIAAIEPYGVGADAWLCPVDKVAEEKEEIGRRSSYIPTPFDHYPITPVRWNQPWLTERGNLHGKGAHIAMPDGSIQTMLQVGSN